MVPRWFLRLCYQYLIIILKDRNPVLATFEIYGIYICFLSPFSKLYLINFCDYKVFVLCTCIPQPLWLPIYGHEYCYLHRSIIDLSTVLTIVMKGKECICLRVCLLLLKGLSTGLPIGTEGCLRVCLLLLTGQECILCVCEL